MNNEDFITYQETTFDAFCKRVIKNEGKNARREISRRESHEITFSALPDAVVAQLSSTDSYDMGSATFQIGKDTVTIKDAALAQAISALPEHWRNVILLFYFLDKTDKQISTALNLTPDAVYYRRKNSLSELKKALKELERCAEV